MTAITATLYGANTPPLVQVAVTGVPGTSTITVTREVAGTPVETIPGAYGVPAPGGALVLLDPAPVIGRPAVYVVTERTAAGVVSEYSAPAVTVPNLTRHVLSDTTTGESVQVDVLAPNPERAQPRRGTTLRVAGRRDPVDVTDVRDLDQLTLVVLTRSPGETADLLTLLASGRVIASRHKADACDYPPAEYLSVGDYARTPYGPAGWTIHYLTAQVEGQPDPFRRRRVVTLQDLYNYLPPPADLGDIAATWTTLADLAQDDLGAA